MHSRDNTAARIEVPSASAARRMAYQPRADGVTFRCEACATELHDLRSVFLARRSGAGWRIECAQHDDAERQVNGGTLFGGGLHALEVYAELSKDQGFDPVALFGAFVRLRQQTSGVDAVAVEPARAAKG